MNLIDCPPGEIASGEILFDGRDLLKASPAERRAINGKRIAMIFQDPLSHLNPVYTVGWQLGEVMRVHGVTRVEAAERALELMRRVGIPEPEAALDKYPHQFSGGQRQRVMIAMALAMKPDIIIADEPTTALDVTVQAEVLKLLEELQDEMGMGLVLITHDLGVVAEVADRVVVMNAGEIVEAGTPSEIYHHAKHPYTRKLIAAAPGKGAMSTADRGRASRSSRSRAPPRPTAPFKALDDVSFELEKGEVLAVVGESRLGQVHRRQGHPAADRRRRGKALWKGRDLFAMPPRDLYAMRREIQMVFQDPTQSLNPRMSIYQIISEAWVIHPDILPKARWRERVAELLAQVGLTPEHAEPLPAPVLRRPAPAHRHRPRARARARAHHRRRGGLRPRRLDPGPGDRAARQAQARARHRLHLHRPRPAGGARLRRPRHGHGEGPRRRDRHRPRDLRAPRQPYTRRLLAAGLDPDPEVQKARRLALA